MNIDISKYPIENWDCYDERLPQSKDFLRSPAEPEFVATIRDWSQLVPVLMGFNDQEGWFLCDGAKRILAIREIRENTEGVAPESWTVKVQAVLGITSNDGDIISMLINAQRSDNPIHMFAVIKHILETDKSANYKSIAETIHRPVAYVKQTFMKFGNIPDWTLAAVLDGKIATTTALAVGSFAKGVQAQCKEEFEEKGKLSLKDAANKRKVVQAGMVAKMAPGLGMTKQDANVKPFFPRKVLIDMQTLLDAGQVDQVKKMLKNLLK